MPEDSVTPDSEPPNRTWTMWVDSAGRKIRPLGDPLPSDRQIVVVEESALIEAQVEIERLRKLVLAAPSYIGARLALHNEWLRQAEEVVGPAVYGDHDLPDAS